MSVLFSEVINKTTNQMTSTCEEVAHPSQDAPQPPHLIINMNSKPVAESLEPSDIAVTITSNPYINHASQKSEGSRHNKFHSNKFQVTKEITSKLRMQEREQRKSFNNTKIRMNNSFMLRMENRKTHGNIINSNIRPLSAGIMSKMSNQKMKSRLSNNKKASKRTQNSYIIKQKKPRPYSKRSEVANSKRLAVSNSRKQRLMSATHNLDKYRNMSANSGKMYKNINESEDNYPLLSQ